MWWNSIVPHSSRWQQHCWLHKKTKQNKICFQCELHPPRPPFTLPGLRRTYHSDTETCTRAHIFIHSTNAYYVSGVLGVECMEILTFHLGLYSRHTYTHTSHRRICCFLYFACGNMAPHTCSKLQIQAGYLLDLCFLQAKAQESHSPWLRGVAGE